MESGSVMKVIDAFATLKFMTKMIHPKPSPWHIADEDFPLHGMPVEKWKFLLQYAVLAPSSHNSQPWLFHISDTHLELYADRYRACPISDPQDRELIMSCGCALFQLRLALSHFGYKGEIQLFPESDERDLLARLALGSRTEESVEETLLFHAIVKRRTNRQPFISQPIPSPLQCALEEAAKKEHARLEFAPDQETKNRMADLISEGDKLQWSDKAFRKELARWVHPNHSKRGDGIPGYARNVGDLLSYAGPLVVRTFDMGDGQAATDHDLASGSPALGVLITDGDSLLDWLTAGQALARVLLRARAQEVWASFLNQPIEVPALRMRVPHAIGHAGFPQAILRFGFGNEVNATPRRAVDDVLI